jgi:hypothetical protein
LFEFENILDLDFNLGFKSISASKELQIHFTIFLHGPSQIRPKSLAVGLLSPVFFFPTATSPASLCDPLRPTCSQPGFLHFQLSPAPSSPSSGSCRSHHRSLLTAPPCAVASPRSPLSSSLYAWVRHPIVSSDLPFPLPLPIDFMKPTSSRPTAAGHLSPSRPCHFPSSSAL